MTFLTLSAAVFVPRIAKKRELNGTIHGGVTISIFPLARATSTNSTAAGEWISKAVRLGSSLLSCPMVQTVGSLRHVSTF